MSIYPPDQVVPDIDQDVNLEEIEDAIVLTRETRTNIRLLKEVN